jgi:hypothetical protein
METQLQQSGSVPNINTVVSPTSSQKKRKTGDEIWEELLATPESQTLLRLMADEALKEHKEGKTTEGGFA